jgi:small subunit ribosomal protein S20
MANYASSIRRIRKSEAARQRNRAYNSSMKTAVKSVLAATQKEDAENKFRKTASLLDKLAAKGLIHKNKAANQKARLALFVNNL